MYFDRFDIVEAHYAFACDYHSGQWSELYARLCRISKYFTPSPMWKGFDSLSENGKEIYQRLVDKEQAVQALIRTDNERRGVR